MKVPGLPKLAASSGQRSCSLASTTGEPGIMTLCLEDHRMSWSRLLSPAKRASVLLPKRWKVTVSL